MTALFASRRGHSGASPRPEPVMMLCLGNRIDDVPAIDDRLATDDGALRNPQPSFPGRPKTSGRQGMTLCLGHCIDDVSAIDDSVVIGDGAVHNSQPSFRGRPKAGARNLYSPAFV